MSSSNSAYRQSSKNAPLEKKIVENLSEGKSLDLGQNVCIMLKVSMK